MSRIRWIFFIVLVIVLWRIDWGPRIINLDEEPDIADPAVEQLTTSHSKAYGGMDRWAFPGLEAWRVERRLRNAGFSCTLPQDPATGGTPQSGVHNLHCEQSKSWPVQRLLQVDARMDYDSYGGRLLAATARSTIEPAAWREQTAGLLRRADFMEPALLVVTGLQADSTETLARIVADSLVPSSWDSFCGSSMHNGVCSSSISARRETGFPAPATKPWVVSDIRLVQHQLGAIGFKPVQRTADSENFTALRIDGLRLWLDLKRKDLTGREEKLALEVSPLGGRAIRLVVAGTSGRLEYALAGKALTFDNEMRQQWLFPLIPGALASPDEDLSSENIRKAVWLMPPGFEEDSERSRRFSKYLPLLDPAFQPLLLKSYMDMLVADNPAEKQLGLQPALQTADRIVQALRASGIPALLGKAEAASLISRDYADSSDPDQLMARAAWALYQCENADFGVLEIQPACWQHFVQEDPQAAALLRTDMLRLIEVYASLDPSNPVKKRLQRLALAFTLTGSHP